MASHAGEYRSVPHIESWEALAEWIGRLRRHDTELPLIIQEEIRPQFAGVILPSDPLTSAKALSVIEVATGFAGPMLAGQVTAATIYVSDHDVSMVSGGSEIPLGLLHELRRVGREIEETTAAPADIEWASANSVVYLLQLRPVVNGRLDRSTVEPIEDMGGGGSDDPKVRLRRLARSLDIAMSRAWLVRTSNVAELAELMRSVPFTGQYSVVLLEPPLLAGVVLRQFSLGSDVASTVVSVAGAALREYWKCTLIIKEIIPGIFTGIATRDDSGYWLELASGHFVPKGLVSVSTFRFDGDKNVVREDARQQERAYAITPDGASRYKPSAQRAPSIASLTHILELFDSVWDVLPSVLEFGLTDEGTPYLIDYTEAASLDVNLASSGVIAPGTGCGRLVRSEEADDEQLSGDWHAKNSAESAALDGAEEVVIAATRPYISLLRHLSAPNRRVVGFVFEESGLLNHLALQLREKRIPAIVCTKSHIDSAVERVVCIDAVTRSISGDGRLTWRGRTGDGSI